MTESSLYERLGAFAIAAVVDHFSDARATRLNLEQGELVGRCSNLNGAE